MNLNKFYSLRDNFTIIGLTGRLGSGCSEIAKRLSDLNFVNNIVEPEDNPSSSLDEIKNKICIQYLKAANWDNFQVINYKNVLILHFLYESLKEDSIADAIERMINIIVQNGNSKNKKLSNRFDEVEDSAFIDGILRDFLKNNSVFFQEFKSEVNWDLDLNINFKDTSIAYKLYFEIAFLKFCGDFYDLLNHYNLTKRTRFTHDLALAIRSFGKPEKIQREEGDLEYIYTVAETINRIIKSWRSKNESARFVIDSLKNSLEIMYFKEKFSAFYMVASNKDEIQREKAISDSYLKYGNRSDIDEGVRNLANMDDAEYKTSDFKEGRFGSPDIENCIQKCDYHLFSNHASDLENSEFNNQLIKLIALIKKPGLVTPSTIEHFMQVAYNAKSNSGCISRQVGAVVTDENYSIKAIGWNEVPEFQVPCGLRDVRDLLNGRNSFMFSDFEREGGNYDDKIDFKEKVTEVVNQAQLNKLDGRNCAYCFRDFHNAFEGQKNQVHTRSLHAEENAMMQITKFGGQGIKGGKLFTTASPCELCSKKAFQLGITEIFYIDPYPGIATSHTLKNGMTTDVNPKLIMFQGAVGRAFHKLYEPFISQKDEIAILTKLRPKAKLEDKIKNLTKDKNLRDKISAKFAGKTPNEQDELLDEYLNKLFKE
jgi:deoxycytidylate deaminase